MYRRSKNVVAVALLMAGVGCAVPREDSSASFEAASTGNETLPETPPDGWTVPDGWAGIFRPVFVGSMATGTVARQATVLRSTQGRPSLEPYSSSRAEAPELWRLGSDGVIVHHSGYALQPETAPSPEGQEIRLELSARIGGTNLYFFEDAPDGSAGVTAIPSVNATPYGSTGTIRIAPDPESAADDGWCVATSESAPNTGVPVLLHYQQIDRARCIHFTVAWVGPMASGGAPLPTPRRTLLEDCDESPAGTCGGGLVCTMPRNTSRQVPFCAPSDFDRP